MNIATNPKFTSLREALYACAEPLGYSRDEIAAAIEFSDRKSRRTNPPGEFDRKGCFNAAESTAATCGCRLPTKRWPYPEMHAARTAAHCAELFDVESVTNVRRLGRVFDRLVAGEPIEEVIPALKPA